jgi:PAS domain S-box-containing protein
MDLGLGFDQAAIGMALVGLDGRFLRVNRALCELLGHSEAELLAATIDQLADPDVPADLPTLADLGAAAARQEGQGSFQVERSCRRADGPPGPADQRGGAARPGRPALAEARANLEQGLAAARSFLFDLRPPLLDSAGLEPALRQQLARLSERTGCKTELVWLLEEPLDGDLETVAFRVVQEALANVARHADATAVRVRAERDGTMVALEVTDDGVGFDPEAARERAAATGHLGLRSMAERIQTAGGSLEIASRPGEGTRVLLRLPA